MGLFDLFKKKTAEPASIAKQRVQMAIVADRANCSTDVMEKIKNDILSVLSKYVEIDVDHLDVQITQMKSEFDDTKVPALYANIPLKDEYSSRR